MDHAPRDPERMTDPPADPRAGARIARPALRVASAHELDAAMSALRRIDRVDEGIVVRVGSRWQPPRCREALLAAFAERCASAGFGLTPMRADGSGLEGRGPWTLTVTPSSSNHDRAPHRVPPSRLGPAAEARPAPTDAR